MLTDCTQLESGGHRAAPVLWITGLAGSGKSTLARALHARVDRPEARVLLLDGDEFRSRQMGRLAGRFDRTARLATAWRLAKHACALQRQGCAVIVATQSLFTVIHRWNRRSMPIYAEVVLRVPFRVLRMRRSEMYQTPRRQVVGRDQRAEFPQAAELELRGDGDSPSASEQLERTLGLWHSLQVGG